MPAQLFHVAMRTPNPPPESIEEDNRVGEEREREKDEQKERDGVRADGLGRGFCFFCFLFFSFFSPVYSKSFLNDLELELIYAVSRV